MTALPFILLALRLTAAPVPSFAAAQGGTASVAAEPADSLYRVARTALGAGDYARAAQLFHDIQARYPRAGIAPDAIYYEAFARYRSGSGGDLERARDLLATLRDRYPSYERRTDAAALSTRICGALAQQGDASCAASIATEAASAARAVTAASAEATAASAEAAIAARAARSARATSAEPGPCAGNEDDDRVAALNALMQMDASRAEPILQKVLARRDACSARLRRTALMIVAQQHSPQAVDILLHVAQTDPDPDVRGQAVFWLSQVPSERTATVLTQILRTSTDPQIRDKAIFALSQMDAPQAHQLLRDYASDASAPEALRERAIFWLGQQNAPGNIDFLKSLFERLTDRNLKERTLFAIGQSHAAGTADWLLQIARNSSEPLETRKRALFDASQAGLSTEQLAHFYDTAPADMREQAIFALSQRNDRASFDKLASIARSDKDPQARKRAIFWLGQSSDPRAADLLRQVIDQ